MKNKVNDVIFSQEIVFFKNIIKDKIIRLILHCEIFNNVNN
jgi:hypothetical protein